VSEGIHSIKLAIVFTFTAISLMFVSFNPFPALVFIELIVLPLLCKYANDVQRKWMN